MIADRRLERFRIFNERGGKFRVAVANVCNLDCFFCHNEAMPNPRRGEGAPARLGDDRLVGILNAFAALGGRQINLTGGEPLAHPGLLPILDRLERRSTVTVLNTNAILADRLLRVPKHPNLDQIFASLHTTDDDVFRDKLAGRSIGAVMDHIVALRDHGYDVQINYSLGPYNAAEFERVLDFAVRHRIALKAIALVRPHGEEGWADPATLAVRGAREISTVDALGGRTTTYEIGGTRLKIKNIAQGRLVTDFCDGCAHRERCGEGIYGLRVGVDGYWKPCLLRREKFVPVTEAAYREQILDVIDAMIGDWSRARFVTGAPR